MQLRTKKEALRMLNQWMNEFPEFKQLGYRIQLNTRLRWVYAYCDHLQRRLSFMVRIACYATDFHLRQMFLHEMAHAVVNEGHTPKFRKYCAKIGCLADRAGWKWNMDYVFNDKPYKQRNRYDYVAEEFMG